MTGLTPGRRPVGSLSLDEIEEELATTERRLAAFRETSRRSHAASAAEAAALREMGARAKKITSRPMTWREVEAIGRGGARGAQGGDAVESGGHEPYGRGDESTSAEARELGERQQELSKRRAELVPQWGQQGHTTRP